MHLYRPTRELSRPTTRHDGQLTEPKITSYRGAPEALEASEERGQIIVGTLGRVNEMLKKKWSAAPS